ncbi:unnamed protein product [Bathycoccus prasinos]
MAGTYDITYECSWTLSGSQVSNTGEQHLLTFSIFHGCDDYLPTTAGVRVQDIFLLSSPEFLVAKAGSVDIVKENVFRSFDTNPLDGTLSYDELKTALETHDVDTGYLEKLNAQGGIGNGVMLSDVMNSATLPFDQTSKTSKVYIDSIVYPKDSTYIGITRVYQAMASDIILHYVDGRLFSEHVGSDTGGIPFSLSDERPSSGTGDNAVTLVVSFYIRCGTGHEYRIFCVVSLDGAAADFRYENFESCDPGGYCLKASTASTGYDYEDANSMANSAVMTWLYRHGYKKSGSVSSANDVSVSIASSSSLTTGEWHHVAFVSNTKFGLTDGTDGANVAWQWFLPGSAWEYLITTKYGDVNTMTVDSDPVTFTVPWYGIAALVVAGKSDVPGPETSGTLSIQTIYTPSTLDVRVLDYDNEDDAGDSGMRCVESANDPIASTSTSGISYLEITYKCTGTHAGAFPGRYITVLSTTDVGVTMDISNVAVTGEEIECPYTSFSDDDGQFRD